MELSEGLCEGVDYGARGMGLARSERLSDLDLLRGEVDVLDERLHGLLEERARLARKIGEVKVGEVGKLGKGGRGGKVGKVGLVRLGREAEGLSRLKERAFGGVLRFEELVWIWREMTAAMARLQGDLWASAAPGCEAAARKVFGMGGDVRAALSVEEALEAARGGGAEMAVAPRFDALGEAEGWWRALEEGGDLRVLGRAPLWGGLELVEGWCVGRGDMDDSRDDWEVRRGKGEAPVGMMSGASYEGEWVGLFGKGESGEGWLAGKASRLLEERR